MLKLTLIALISTLTPALDNSETGTVRSAPATLSQASVTIVAPGGIDGRIVRTSLDRRPDTSRTLSLELDWNQPQRADRAKRTDRIQLNHKQRFCRQATPVYLERSCILSQTENPDGSEMRLLIAVPMATDYP